MKKLKLAFDDLENIFEPLNSEEQNELKGGTGAYFGYDTMDDFLSAVQNGQVAAGTYTFDNGAPGQYYDYGSYADYGGYGGYSLTGIHSATVGGPDDCIVNVQKKGSTQNWDLDMCDKNGLCFFESLIKVASKYGSQVADEAALFSKYVDKGYGTVVTHRPDGPQDPRGINTVDGVATDATIMTNFFKDNSDLDVKKFADMTFAERSNWFDNGGTMIVGTAADLDNDAVGHFFLVEKNNNLSEGSYKITDSVTGQITYRNDAPSGDKVMVRAHQN